MCNIFKRKPTKEEMVKVNNFMNFEIGYFEGARRIMFSVGSNPSVLYDDYQDIYEYFTKHINQYIDIIKNNPSHIEIEHSECTGTELTLLDGSKVFVPRCNQINKTSSNILFWKDVWEKVFKKREIYNDEILSILRKYDYLD